MPLIKDKKIKPVIVLRKMIAASQWYFVVITQWLIEWENLTREDSSWEDANFVKQLFPKLFANTLKKWFPDCYT
jgi:cell division protein FtsL